MLRNSDGSFTGSFAKGEEVWGLAHGNATVRKLLAIDGSAARRVSGNARVQMAFHNDIGNHQHPVRTGFDLQPGPKVRNFHLKRVCRQKLDTDHESSTNGSRSAAACSHLEPSRRRYQHLSRSHTLLTINPYVPQKISATTTPAAIRSPILRNEKPKPSASELQA